MPLLWKPCKQKSHPLQPDQLQGAATQAHKPPRLSQNWWPSLSGQGQGLLPCRYADVIVHRLLGAALALSVLPPTIKDPQALRSLADNLNNRHRNAQFAGRASVELYTLMYFKDRTILADARITKVRLQNG